MDAVISTYRDKLFQDSLIIAMQDQKDAIKTPRIIEFKQAKELNKQGYGIFVTINGFKDKRVKEALTSINAWAIDLDKGTKAEQMARIERSPLPPTMIIESKNGYHVWWAAKDGNPSHYEEILKRLVDFFDADKNAKDITRLLRLPQFKHMKDPQNPFDIEIVFWNPRTFAESEMLMSFKDHSEPYLKEHKGTYSQFKSRNNTMVALQKNKWLKNDLNASCKDQLQQLSGTHWVNGDEFEFVPHPDGTEQIWVNGASSSCWIDKNGKIGSHDKGGPTTWQWLNWYYKDKRKVSQIMKEVFGV